MGEDVIREVEAHPGGATAVTIEETAESVRIPPRCAGCLAEPTKRLAIAGVTWLKFPYCDACVAPRPGRKKRKHLAGALTALAFVLLLVFRSLWSCLILCVMVIPFLRHASGGSAVRLMLSESGTVRLEFRNEVYARLFVEANAPDSSRRD